MNDGQTVKSEKPEITDGHIILLKDSKYTHKDVEEIKLASRIVSK
jgi:hypothetical protein